MRFLHHLDAGSLTSSPLERDGMAASGADTEPVVLVVEDDRLLRRMTCETLCDEGLEAVSASGGEEALRVLDGHARIALLFTDINMPGMSGLALAGLARARKPDLKVVVTSGRQYLERHELPAPARFLAKPYTASQLLHAVRTSLAE